MASLNRILLNKCFTTSLNLLKTNRNIDNYFMRKISIQTILLNEKKENINIGTIGHIDHGKTTLTSAITKVMSEKKVLM